MIHINEVFPNPKGKDTGNEWLEFFNDAPYAASLGGWHLAVNGKSVALRGFVPADGYRALGSKDLRRTLTNREVKIGLYGADGRLEDALIVRGTTHEGKSYSRFEDGVFHWTDPTPSAVNTTGHAVVIVENTLPTGVNLVAHGSFTHALGSGMLMALILSLLVTSILYKGRALPWMP